LISCHYNWCSPGARWLLWSGLDQRDALSPCSLLLVLLGTTVSVSYQTGLASGLSLIQCFSKPWTDGRRSPGSQNTSENSVRSLSTSSCFLESSLSSPLYPVTQPDGLVFMCWPGKVVSNSGSNWAIFLPFEEFH
jgi:hypothetical protein